MKDSEKSQIEVTLTVNEQEKTFSKEELAAILEKYFFKDSINQGTIGNWMPIPIENKWFNVNLQQIDQNLFETKRLDKKQEETRQLILEAIVEVNANPEKYSRKFKTIMPAKTWHTESVKELKKFANNLGGHNADWVEQALEWAQRIDNGESWESVCNKPDTANWYRLVEWKNGCMRLIGGSREDNNTNPATTVFGCICDFNVRVSYTVPLVVVYEDNIIQ